MYFFRIIGGVATLCFAFISFFSAAPGSTYRYSFFFLSLFLWLLYGMRARLVLHPFHFALFASALLLHDLGVFDLYRRKFFSLEFDFYVHYYFGVISSLIFYRALRHYLPFRRAVLCVTVLICILGFGAIHELMEYASNLILGPEKGMLKAEAGPYDTQEDLAHNAFGAMTGLALYLLWERCIQRKNSDRSARSNGS